MARRGFDEDDDTDRDDDPSPPRRGDRSERQNNNRRSGGKGQSKNEYLDVESDPNVLVRYLDVVIRGLGEKIGLHAAQHSALVQAFLGFLQKQLGNKTSEEVVKFIGAWVQVPAFVKTYLAGMGVSPRVLEYSNGFLDSVFTGTAQSFRENKFNQRHATEVFEKASKELAANMGKLELRSWEEVPGALTTAYSRRLTEVLLELSPDQTAAFRGYRGKLVAGGVKAVEAFITFAHVPLKDQRAKRAMDYLQTTYGPPEQPVVSSFIDKTVKTVQDTAAALRKHFPAPDAAQQAAAVARRTATEQHITDTKAARKNRGW